METGIVPRILERQKPEGYWEKAADFYIRTKYRGTVWQFIILAELGAEGSDPRIRRTCEFILNWAQDRSSRGFAYRGSRERGGHHSGVIPCLTGNMTWALLRFGYGDDPRIQEAIRWMTRYQRCDDAISPPPSGWPYDAWKQCWGRHTCHLGVVKALKALAEIPVRHRSGEVQAFIQRAGEFLLKHHLFKRSRDTARVAKPKWTRLGFPWMWDTDALEMLIILLRLGFRDSRMSDAVELVREKQDGHGRWLLENTDNGRFQVNIERKHQPSKWVTYHALWALSRFTAHP